MKSSVHLRLTLGLLGICAVGMAQTASPSSGVDLKAIDKSVDPCQDFYRYACGNWMKANPIPPQYSVWGRFQELADRNQEVLHGILEDSAKHQDRSPLDQKIGAFYASCMDEASVEKAGDTPIKPAIDRVRALKDKAELAAEVARLHDQAVGVFFSFRAQPDADKSTMDIADVDQGGLGLPDRSYYLEAKDEKTRQKYVEHISRMFQLIGDPPAEADAKAKAILSLETALAKASLDRVARRDPHLTHHKMTVAELEALTPDFDFKQYFSDQTVRTIAQPGGRRASGRSVKGLTNQWPAAFRFPWADHS